MVYQLGAPLLDACVMAALLDGDAYGYVLTKRVQDVIDISESTLYPVLRRLQKDGMLTTYDKQDSGRNRRYYSLTETGHEKLDYYIREWKEYRNKINTLLGGEI
ncbi:MAG: PadR family transcriptional regulator [Lachnospiraceae bacterium]|nr:PadR family transcriptional regulator [Lachnospiraceae bacterium]